MLKIDIIVGARPNFMKIAPIIHILEKLECIKYRLIHTGQHYSDNMSKAFFSNLNIPEPDITFGIGIKTGAIMDTYDNLLSTTELPDLCIVVGDVNSTMACAIAARKHWIDVAHIEAGVRSHDLQMPEEINRIVTDSICNIFFVTSVEAGKNLIHSGVNSKDIHFVGNIMADTLLENINKFEKPEIWDALALEDKKYCVLTLHRPSNVDNPENLSSILSELDGEGVPIILPIHPRTRKVLDEIDVEYKNICVINPLDYLNFNYLVQHSLGVLTDSGGVQAETTIMKVPCITIRRNLEFSETVEIGTNVLAMPKEGLKEAFSLMIRKKWKKGRVPEKWDGKTAERIVDIILKLYRDK